MKKNTRQLKNAAGFTLVELIVVLVVLAILAALLVPALTGYIDRTKRQGAIAQCRACVVAARTLYAERYRRESPPTALTVADDGAEVLALAELDGTPTEKLPNNGFEFVDGRMTHLYYYSGFCYVTYCSDPAQCTKHSESYTVSDSLVSAAYDSTSQLLNTLYSWAASDPYKVSAYDSINVSNPSSKVYQLWNALTPAQQAFLEGTTWRLDQNYGTFNSGGLFTNYVDTNSTGNKAWRLRVANQTADGTGVSYTVYALGIGTDGQQHVYKQSYTGGQIVDGKLTTTGSPVTAGLPYKGWSLVE